MIRYVLRAMTLEDAHKQGFSTKWFDERAKTHNEIVEALAHWSTADMYRVLDRVVSWPTGDGP